MPGFPFDKSPHSHTYAFLPPPLARDSAIPAYNLSQHILQPGNAHPGTLRLAHSYTGYPSPAVSEADVKQFGLDTVLEASLPATPKQGDPEHPNRPVERSLQETCSQIEELLRQATIDQLTSPAFDSWIFYMQRMQELGLFTGRCVLEKHWWDNLRQQRFEAWSRDLSERSWESQRALEELIRKSARQSW
ncbi:hypothetical protein BCR37DRAFT_391001 [Protomyces lactucae-debilis]|uniref:Uncharacterized protein n=1 Tax=Protomyces lactucae-debilis TaxID=2754530 RepID=A0A1Y2FQE2_PROLT|nr:uncharacterized protein BCR37DRAFT_391001 [Protomyces lactucae-debilis]ORY86200.1 hypothetical protein BCR37DRAFT_391001 [Protomyces lactucae-debilis]